MQWIYSMVTLLIIHIIGTAALIEDGENPSCACSPNSSFVQCGDYCERSCGWYSGEPRGCSIKRCAPRGCYCDFGYARNAVGICIIAEECKQICASHQKLIINFNCLWIFLLFWFWTKGCNTATEEYLSCGADCPETCENSAEDIAKDPGCGLYCISGCFCKNGLVRRSDGLCVNPGKCFRSSRLILWLIFEATRKPFNYIRLCNIFYLRGGTLRYVLPLLGTILPPGGPPSIQVS